MKKFLILMGLWIAFVIFVVFKAVTANLGSQEADAILGAVRGGACSAEFPRTEGFLNSTEAGIRKLGELEEKCKSTASNELMYFTIMPKDAINAKELSSRVSKTVMAFNEHGIRPIVIVEPDSAWGLIDFTEFNTGFYDSFIDVFFKELKASGLTDEMMGTWVPFPEANLPYWNHQNTTPSDFAQGVNRYLGIMKKYFPKTKGSVLLNSATYETDDYNWAEGEYVSLRPYLEGLKKEYVDSFGLQGLPWMPANNQDGKPIFEPAEYLNANLAAESADILGVKKIWFNTGSFAAKYASTNETKTQVPAEIRKQILEKTIEQAYALKTRGYEVSVNLFSEDKSNTAEGTDWSYWGSDYTTNSAHSVALVDFLKELYKKQIGISFFFKQ